MAPRSLGSDSQKIYTRSLKLGPARRWDRGLNLPSLLRRHCIQNASPCLSTSAAQNVMTANVITAPRLRLDEVNLLLASALPNSALAMLFYSLAYPALPTIDLSSAWTCFRRYLLNGRIDRDETWAQGVSACDYFFVIYSYYKNIRISGSCHLLVMLSMAPTPFKQCSSAAKATAASHDLGCDP